MFESILQFLFGERCKKCGAREHRVRSSRYARGWNHLCTQAAGDYGVYCSHCHTVHFEKTDEEYLDTLPDWCTHKGQIGRGIKSGFGSYNLSVVDQQLNHVKKEQL